MFGANFVILAQIYDELSCLQAEFPRLLSPNGQNDIEGQGQWTIFSIATKSIPGCMFVSNLVILSQMYDELPRGQAEFPRILSQNDQNYLHFSYQPRLCPKMHVWPKFGDSRSNLWRVIVRTR